MKVDLPMHILSVSLLDTVIDIDINFVYVNPWTHPVTDEKNRELVQKSFYVT